MLSAISFVGFSSSGKTSLLEKVVCCLKARGYRVGVIKHASHELEFDRPGKDSWRLARAGADMVALASSTQTALVEQRGAEATPQDALALLEGKVDIALTEGYKYGPFLKVLVCRGPTPPLPWLWEWDELWAIVTPVPLPCPVPQVHPKDIGCLVELLVSADQGRHSPNSTAELLPQAVPETGHDEQF